MGEDTRQTSWPYDDGYNSCACFWGHEPGSLVVKLLPMLPENLAGHKVLDAGCGEAKNAYFLAERGAEVLGIDGSSAALENARRAGPASEQVDLRLGNILECEFEPQAFDVVIAYGLLHCLPTPNDATGLLLRMMSWTRRSGHLIVCCFNDRYQELEAHPGFDPTLLKHSEIVDAVQANPEWEVIFESDTDLHEVHPHNEIPHAHSMTRLIAQRAGA